MKYINNKTGAVIETGCAISGGDWRPAESAPAPAPVPADAAPEPEQPKANNKKGKAKQA